MPVQVTHPLFANTAAGCSARKTAPIAGNIIHFFIENASLPFPTTKQAPCRADPNS
jgi:hypothetical protein